MPLHSAAQWGKNFDKVVYERPVLHSMNKLAETEDPRSVQGTMVAGASLSINACKDTGQWCWLACMPCLLLPGPLQPVFMERQGAD
eukprot:scaffold307292_cov17-Tisochrysis_lutea.AAC.1